MISWGLVDSGMNEVVTYSYDTWGKLLGIGGSMASTVGALNPLRYRGYMYDSETGLYYLQSRYYDPNTGRFLNADGAVSTGTGLLGLNMFAYSNNNPVNLVDNDGTRPVAEDSIGNETAAEAAVSTAAMYSAGENPQYVNKVKASEKASKKSSGNTAVTVGESISSGIGDAVASSIAKSLKNTKTTFNVVKGTAPLYEDAIETFSEARPVVSAFTSLSHVGVASIFFLLIDAGLDSCNYSGLNLAGAILIDGVSLGSALLAGIGIAALIAAAPIEIPAIIGLAATVAISAGIAYESNKVKNVYLKRK